MGNTSSLVTLALHTYMGMIEYNTVYKGTRSIGVDASPEIRFNNIINNIATLLVPIMDSDKGTLSRMRIWRALPYVLHYAYRDKVPYITINKHFPIGKEYDEKPKFDLSELRNEKNFYIVSELASITGMWGDYFSIVPQDYLWLPAYNGAKQTNTLNIPSLMHYMIQTGFDVLADSFPYDNPKQKHFADLLKSEYSNALVGLLFGSFYPTEARVALDISNVSYTVNDYNTWFRSDLSYKHRHLIVDFGFRALYKMMDFSYKVVAIDFTESTGE